MQSKAGPITLENEKRETDSKFIVFVPPLTGHFITLKHLDTLTTKEAADFAFFAALCTLAQAISSYLI